MRAYLVLKARPQDTANVLHQLQQEEAITEASLIHGPYDCIAHVEARDLQAINEAVMHIRALPGVLDTMTCLVVQSWQRAKK